MKTKYLGILNRSKIPDSDVSGVLETVNQQVTEDFVPIWGAGSGYQCILLSSQGDQNIDYEHLIYVVDELERFEPPDEPAVSVFVVSSQFGDLAVTLSHQVFELIVNRRKY